MVYLICYIFLLFSMQGCSLNKSNVATNLRSFASHDSRVTNIPADLCLNNAQPIDANEERTVSEKLVSNTLEHDDALHFNQLPREVQKIIELTTGSLYMDGTFECSVILSHDPAQENRSIKNYIYTPIVFDKNLGCKTLALDSWRFKRQNKLLKLDWCDLGA